MPRITIDLTDADARRLREKTGTATTAAALRAILQPLTLSENPAAPARARKPSREASDRLVRELRAEDRRGGGKRFKTARAAMRHLGY